MIDFCLIDEEDEKKIQMLRKDWANLFEVKKLRIMNQQEYGQIQRQQSNNTLQSDCCYDSEQWHYVNSPMKQIEGNLFYLVNNLALPLL